MSGGLNVDWDLEKCLKATGESDIFSDLVGLGDGVVGLTLLCRWPVSVVLACGWWI
jgi:hypothetical protein